MKHATTHYFKDKTPLKDCTREKMVLIKQKERIEFSGNVTWKEEIFLRNILVEFDKGDKETLYGKIVKMRAMEVKDDLVKSSLCTDYKTFLWRKIPTCFSS